MNFGLRGRVIMVTGGGSGIGRETALLAARDGARIIVCDANSDSAQAVNEEIREIGGDAVVAVFDVTDAEATESCVESSEREFGPIAGLVAAAGISQPQLAEQILEQGYRR
jgi:NAD(P)-dependent dehydrogenase (short-subunit alcohol dehydrogenase family)